MARKFVCTTTEPVVQTKYGKLRGFILDGTYTFYGIKYADAGRFQLPKPPKSWEGVKDALGYGYVCPMLRQDEPGSGELKVPHRYWPMDENCQYLNIWTQSVDLSAKKPVMVWLHGGGFAAGSSIEQQAYDGDALSRFGDVVVVTLNHRLNILGYLDLSPFGEKYKNSGNAGNADMVAALQWIHDNIAAFGGDPENVTLFGQSGGGMKVYSLMQTPSADGLFHKGIIQSGVANFKNKVLPDGTKIVHALMEELKLKDVEELETVPYEDLAMAYNKVSPALSEAGIYVGGSGPIPDDFYPGDPFVIGFTDHAKTISVMVGTVLDEFPAFGPGYPNRHTMTKEEGRKLVADKFGEKNADQLIDLFEKAYPDKPISDLVMMDGVFRKESKDFIKMKAGCTESATYSYSFTLELPVDEGSGPWHCSEIPFVFHNATTTPYCNIPGVTEKLEYQMASAWVNFAKYGNPNDPSLPEWPASTADDEACMIFDKECEVRHNHDNQLVDLHIACAPAFKPDSKVKVEH